MNRLRILLIGAALATGGSALASAQAVRQDIAFHDHDRDRDGDRGRDRGRDRDRRDFRDRDHDRDDRRYFDRDRDRRYDYGYVRGERRWDGHRWFYWNGYGWVY